MCIIVVKPKEVSISRERLKNCWENNSDGAGFMYQHGDRVIIEKGFMTWKSFWRAYQSALRGKAHNRLIVMHFRWATHGIVSPENTHPFRVNEGLAFVHNGLFTNGTWEIDKIKSDTRVFCEEVLQKLPPNFLENEAICTLLEEVIGWGRVVFMDNKNQIHIFNEKKGIWNDGCWFSNSDYKYIRKLRWTNAYCYVCGKYLATKKEREEGYCSKCLREYFLDEYEDRTEFRLLNGEVIEDNSNNGRCWNCNTILSAEYYKEGICSRCQIEFYGYDATAQRLLKEGE